MHCGENAAFHARVDPNFYLLAHPDYYMDEPTFHDYVRKALAAFLTKNPTILNEVNAIICIVNI
jgi:hypothetical protein